jgi:5'-3' exonuclease
MIKRKEIRSGQSISQFNLKKNKNYKRERSQYEEQDKEVSQILTFKINNSNLYTIKSYELLKIMGILVIDSPCGEGEKTCALLNILGKCDAVITNDSDALLYGTRCLYRNFTVKQNEVIYLKQSNH